MCLDGLKNYPITDTSDEYYPGYNDLLKRTPIMFGFNVPTCKVLDVLSLEAEWWDSYPFANSYWGFIRLVTNKTLSRTNMFPRLLVIKLILMLDHGIGPFTQKRMY
jgi:hypothetical protein